MRINYFFVAEALAQDALGGLTAVRIGQNVAWGLQLPTMTQRAVVLSMIDDGGDMVEGDHVTVTFEVTSPVGLRLSRIQQLANLGPKLFQDLPAELLVPGSLLFPLNETGAYRISVSTVDSRGATDEAESFLYVMDRAPADLTQEMTAPPEGSESDD